MPSRVMAAATAVALLAVMAAIFAVDIVLTRATAASIPYFYAAPVLLSARLRYDHHVIFVALLATALIALGFLFSPLPNGAAAERVLIDQCIGLILIWASFAAIWVRRRDIRRTMPEDVHVNAALSGASAERLYRLPGRVSFRAAFEGSAVGMAILDSENKCRVANQALCDLLGYEAAEVPGMALEVLVVTEATAEPTRRGDVAGTDVAAHRSRESRLRRKDGTPTAIRAEITEISGGPWSTTFKLLQAVESGRMKGVGDSVRDLQGKDTIAQLTGGIAHDFNDILQVMSISLDLIEQEGGSTGIVREQLHRMLKACERGSILTRRLLAMSGSQMLVPRETDINALVGKLVAVLDGGLDEGIILDTDLAAGLWPVKVDAARLESALVDLVLNARDAMPAGGKLTIRTRNRTAGEATTGATNTALAPADVVEVAVIDTGKGIGTQDLDRVWEPFYTTKQGAVGSGLGLGVVHGFATQSGGFVEIDSAPGRGTRVSICLPRCNPARNAARPFRLEDVS